MMIWGSDWEKEGKEEDFNKYPFPEWMERGIAFIESI